jgi:hypothetical protein
MEADMVTSIPDKDFAGWIVLDWEAWEATWGFASAEYRNASVALARSLNPGVTSEAALEQIAAAAYTKASVELLALTAKTSARLRPKAKGVGFYGLPHKQYWPTPQLNKTQQGWNDLMLPLWKECTALYPSIYMPYESGCHDAGCQTLQLNTQYVEATIKEAVRISKEVGGSAPLPVVPYAWYRYHDGEPKGLQFMNDADANLQFAHPLTMAGPSTTRVFLCAGEAASCLL